MGGLTTDASQTKIGGRDEVQTLSLFFLEREKVRRDRGREKEREMQTEQKLQVPRAVHVSVFQRLSPSLSISPPSVFKGRTGVTLGWVTLVAPARLEGTQ